MKKPIYEHPDIQVVEIVVEKGFAQSTGTGNSEDLGNSSGEISPQNFWDNTF